MSKLIAIGGLKNSGKDTVAEMLQYCLSTPKILHKFWIYKWLKIFIIKKWKITSFASTLKQSLAILINIPSSKFNNREFKEKYYICLKNLEITNVPKVSKIITDKKLSTLIKSGNLNTISNYYITIRQLLQIFGTEIIREYFGDEFWVLRTLKSADSLIISDLRFSTEYDKIKQSKGITIYIDRQLTPGPHRSESEIISLFQDNKFDYIINNTKTLSKLFNEVSNVSATLKY